MKKILLVITLMSFAGVATYAQENENQKAVREMAEKGFFGHFDYRYDDIHTINVNYSITPRIPSSELNFRLHTPEARPLSIAIVNSKGQKVKSWNPSQENYVYESSINVANLPSGKYAFVILWDNKEAHRIAFDKK